MSKYRGRKLRKYGRVRRGLGLHTRAARRLYGRNPFGRR